LVVCLEYIIYNNSQECQEISILKIKETVCVLSFCSKSGGEGKDWAITVAST
jgi:hypothetical protein